MAARPLGERLNWNSIIKPASPPRRPQPRPATRFHRRYAGSRVIAAGNRSVARDFLLFRSAAVGLGCLLVRMGVDEGMMRRSECTSGIRRWESGFW